MTSHTTTQTSFNVKQIRGDFPILSRVLESGKRLVYLDNAATSQKPKPVIDALIRYYETHNANVHRGVHILSEEATDLYEGARNKVKVFLNARASEEIIFLRGTTEAINLVAQSWARPRLTANDEVLVTRMEHHSNIVPWQMVCQQTGATLRVVDMDPNGALDMASFQQQLNERTKVFACVHISNALGTINPVQQLIAKAKDQGATVVVDGAQAAPHIKIDVQHLNADFYAVSGHKMFAPTGIGALYGRQSLLQAMEPYQGGGEMIKYVSFERTEYNDLPHRFEAGTPNIAGAVGLGAAVDYLSELDWPTIVEYEDRLLAYAHQRIGEISGVRLIGQAAEKAGVVSFWMEGAHPHDIGTILSHQGICVRTGHHCAQPVMQFYDVPATTRASLAFYNTKDEIDALAEGLVQVRKVLLG